MHRLSKLGMLMMAAIVVSACGSDDEGGSPGGAGATGGSGGSGGSGGVPGTGGSAGSTSPGSGGAGGTLGSGGTASGGQGGGGECSAPRGIDYDARGCLTFMGASVLCGFESDDATCAMSVGCDLSSDDSQCKINCEMGTTVNCYTVEDVDCLVQATCAASCEALSACGFIL
jgi:hypothetical protein